MTSPKELKQHFRKEALARRDNLDPVWRIEQALHISETMSAAIAVEPGQVVSGYWPMRSEIDVRPLLYSLAERRARLCLPAILDKTTMVFRELVRGAPLVAMGFGTFGPDATAEVLDPAVMLVPLAAFDARGHRIGYGGGFFDRTLATLPRRAFIIGVGYATSRLATIYPQPHDIAMDAIVTDA